MCVLAVFQQFFEQRDHLVLFEFADVDLIFQHGVFVAVAVPVVCCALAPSVQYRLMPPMIILPAEDKRVFYPHKAFGKFGKCAVAHIVVLDFQPCATLIVDVVRWVGNDELRRFATHEFENGCCVGAVSTYPLRYPPLK